MAADLDTAKLSELRSLVAEAAAVETAHAHGRLTAAYVDGQRDDIRQALEKLLTDPALKPWAEGALAALDRGDAAALGRAREQLVAIERTLGRGA
jgi:hypothetical protein